jgi:hypothetical protein
MPVTSIKQVLGRGLPMSDIKAHLREIMEQRFNLNAREVSLPDFLSHLETWKPGLNAGA